MAWCGRVAASFASFVQDFCALRRCREFAPAGDLLYCCATGVPAQNKVGKQMRPAASVPESFALRIFRGRWLKGVGKHPEQPNSQTACESRVAQQRFARVAGCWWLLLLPLAGEAGASG